MKFKQKILNLFRNIFSHVFTKFFYKISLLNNKISKKIYTIDKEYHFNNKKITIFSNYRYKIKHGWRFFNSLDSLYFLKKKNLLNEKEIFFFENAIGTRTLTIPIQEINIFSQKVCQKFQKFFFKESLENVPKIKNDLKKHYELLYAFKKMNLKNINFLNYITKRILNINSNILEIGYTSGGYSTMAYQELGFNSFGIDNFYDGNFDQTCPIYKDARDQLKSRAVFLKGDISKKNLGYEKMFDLIYSTSVLEHIRDIDSSFLEMNRLLKDNGIIFHHYGPYFCVKGGHALGIGDCPYMHLQLSHNEYISYLKINRPFESEVATRWINENMNKISQKTMREKIEKAGFEILYFKSFNYDKYNLDLTPKIYKNIKKNYNFLTINDLLGTTVTIIAQKR